MRVYFLSCAAAALKLNGLYIGTIDGFERHIELDPADSVLAEIVPGDNLQPVNFFLNADFFSCPPEFADVYTMDGDALIYIREYAAKNVALKVIYQTRFCGNLVTVFTQGGVYLSVDGASYLLKQLPPQFLNATAEEQTLSGRQVLAIRGGNRLVIISESGKMIFSNAVESYEFGDCLSVRAPFETCTAAYAECEFAYDGESLSLVKSRTVETRPPERETLHFAFFEAVLTCGDYVKYLSPALKPKAENLKSYLGEYVSVTVPPEKFFSEHGEIYAAGLVYPLKENLYDVKYFAVQFDGELIDNIYPVEK